MSARKQHNDELGYIAERTNPYVPDTKVVIYEAAKQGIDTGGSGGGGRYALVCDAHSQIGDTTSMPKARELMKAPEGFCLDCRALVEG